MSAVGKKPPYSGRQFNGEKEAKSRRSDRQHKASSIQLPFLDIAVVNCCKGVAGLPVTDKP